MGACVKKKPGGLLYSYLLNVKTNYTSKFRLHFAESRHLYVIHSILIIFKSEIP